MRHQYPVRDLTVSARSVAGCPPMPTMPAMGIRTSRYRRLDGGSKHCAVLATDGCRHEQRFAAKLAGRREKRVGSPWHQQVEAAEGRIRHRCERTCRDALVYLRVSDQFHQDSFSLKKDHQVRERLAPMGDEQRRSREWASEGRSPNDGRPDNRGRRTGGGVRQELTVRASFLQGGQAGRQLAREGDTDFGDVGLPLSGGQPHVELNACPFTRLP